VETDQSIYGQFAARLRKRRIMAEDRKKHAFIALIEIDEDVALTDQPRDQVLLKLLNIAFEFCDSVNTRLDPDDPSYFIVRSNSKFKNAVLLNRQDSNEVANRERVFNEISKESDADIGIEDEIICLAFITYDLIHWDYNFLKLSEHFRTDFTIFGLHPTYGDFARQIYSGGDFDTGIEAPVESSEQYVGEKMLQTVGLSKEFFSLKNYS
jgi:hypothetical protein